MSTKIQLSKEDQSIFFGSASKDLIDFCIAMDRNYDPQWFHEEIAKALMKVARREITRLIIEMPPRHGKSELTTINFPAFYLGMAPQDEIITASYSGDLAQKFGGRCRDVMNNPTYKRIFPSVELRQDTQAKDYWRTNQGGGYMSVGVGGAATGSGADIFLIDDPIKNREEADSEVYRDKIWEWYTNVARTRLEKNGAVIIIMTRWHADDLVGRVLERQKGGSEPWTRITFPAVAEVNDRFRDIGDTLWPGKYSQEDMKAIRNDVGERAWFALYQQTPIATETQVFRPEWLKKEYEPKDLEGRVLNRYATIDTADTDKEGADYIGVTIVDWDSENNWYFHRIKRYRLNILGLVELIFNIWTGDKPLKIGIEKKSFEDQLKPLIDERSEETGIYPVIVELMHGGRRKEARIIGALQGRFERGKIFFKKDASDDTDAFKRESFDFPKGKNDDLIDAAAYIQDIGERPFLQQKEVKTSIQSEMDNYFASQSKFKSRARRI